MTKPIPQKLLAIVHVWNPPLTMSRDPVKLTPLVMGEPDMATAKMVIQNIIETTPGFRFPWRVRIAQLFGD